MRHVADFLRHALRLPGSRLLSYQAVMVALTRFFDRNGRMSPTAEQSARLAQYVWRAGFSTRYYADAGSRTEQDMKLMEAIAADLPGELDTERGPLTASDIILAPLKPSWAFPATVLAALAHMRPVDIASGAEVALDNSNLVRANSRHYHHIFPTKWLVSQGVSPEAANSVANIMLVSAQTNLKIHAQPPSKYMAKYAAQAGDPWGRWLRTHLIGAAATRAMMRDDYDAFLEARAKTIAEKANKLMGLDT